MTPIAPSSGISPPSQWPCTFCPEESDWGLDKCPECGHISLLKQAYQQGAWGKVRTLCADVLALSAESISAKSIIHKALDCQVAGILAQAQTHHDRGLWDKALSLCDEALRLSPHVVAAQELIAKTHSRRAADFLSRASDCLARTELDEALALCRTLQSEYPAQSETCGRLRHDISAALIARSAAAMSTDDWQKAEAFAQRALELEPGNSDAARLRTDAQGKLRLKDLAGRAFAAYGARDLSGCRTACEAFLAYQRECGARVEFTVGPNVIDFGALPGRLRQDIITDRLVKVLLIGRRIVKWAVACTVVALLFLGIAHWRKVRFEKSIRTFDTAMQAGAYDAAKAIAPKIADKHTPAADLLTYFRSRESFETALNGANTELLRQYGAAKWADLHAQKQAAEASAGTPAKGVEAYQRATVLLTECQTMAEAGEKARKGKETREKALAEAKAREEREQAERKRAQEARATEQLRERARKDVDYVAANMSQNRSMGNVVEGLNAAGRDSWREAADRGWGEGQVLMGLSYQFGIGVDKDSAKGRTLIRKAAEQGIGLAEFCMAVDIDTSRNPESRGEMISWMKRAAEHGVAQAQATLGGWYVEGFGSLAKDAEAAAKWFKLAAENGNASAQHQLGVCYFYGAGVTKDVDAALKWLRLAARNGEPFAQYSLSTMYRSGSGVEQDTSEALDWCKKAADQGHIGAQNDLGVAFLRGDGVSKNVNEAVRWFRLAAQQGNETAISNLRALNVTPSGWLYKCSNCGRTQKYRQRVAFSVCPVCVGVRADMEYVGPAY